MNQQQKGVVKGSKGVEVSTKLKRPPTSPLSSSTPSRPSMKKTKPDVNVSGVSLMEDEAEGIERLVNEIQVKATKRDSNSRGRVAQSNATHDHLVAAAEKAITNLLPTIVEAISGSVVESLEKKLEEMESKIERLENELWKEKVINAMRQDKHEQFARRDNVVIEGIREKPEGEETRDTLIASVQTIAEVIGVRLTKESIGDIHRVGRRSGGKVRPVVVHTNRWNKINLMRNKKKLKESRAIREDASLGERVTLYEDLTKPRRILLKEVKNKENDNVAFCFTKDGSIIAKLKNGQFVTIENADDLFKIGMDQVTYSAFYDGVPNNAS